VVSSLPSLYWTVIDPFMTYPQWGHPQRSWGSPFINGVRSVPAGSATDRTHTPGPVAAPNLDVTGVDLDWHLGELEVHGVS
jgi:hypothetical protein